MKQIKTNSFNTDAFLFTTKHTEQWITKQKSLDFAIEWTVTVTNSMANISRDHYFQNTYELHM